MTGKEMVYNFNELLLDISPIFRDQQRPETRKVLDSLNRAVDRYIKDRFFSGSSFKENTANISASIDEIRELVTQTPIDPVVTFNEHPAMNKVYLSILPTDFFAYIRSESKITRINVLPVTDDWVPNIETDYNNISNFLTTGYNKPILKSPIVTIKNDDIESATSAKAENMITIVDTHTTISNNMVTYMKKPTKIDISGNDCELSEFLHETIVKYAVEIFFTEYKSRLTPKSE